MPERHVHFHTARRSDIAQVSDSSPAKPIFENHDHCRFGVQIISAHEYIGHFRKFGWFHHYVGIHCIQGLTTLASGNARWICSPSESVLHTVSVHISEE